MKAETGPAKLPPLSSGVPSGSILHDKRWVAPSDGQTVLHSEAWYDFENSRARTDWFNTPTSPAEGAATIPTKAANPSILAAEVWDHGRHQSYNGYSNTVLPADTGQPLGGPDQWPTQDIVRLGQQTLNGKTVDVYRADLNIPRGQERSADFGLIYVDSTSGLRVREEWLVGSPGSAYVAHLYAYDLVPRTDELARYLSIGSLDELVTGTSTKGTSAPRP